MSGVGIKDFNCGSSTEGYICGSAGALTKYSTVPRMNAFQNESLRSIFGPRINRNCWRKLDTTF
jgi:hypothetical protein